MKKGYNNNNQQQAELMGGCRCSFRCCSNTTKTAEHLHFFHYPVKHREQCIKWIENARKPNFFELEEEQLRNKVVCEVHFEKKDFVNIQKNRLVIGAVPTLDDEMDFNETSTHSHQEIPVYLPSNQYKDIKVLPTNEDGTVFVLDTENMFTISPKIESYIIKNGVLVPTNSNNQIKHTPGKLIKQSTSNRFTKPSTSAAGYVMGAETEIANINTPPGPSKSLLKNNNNNNNKLFHRPSFIKHEETIDDEYNQENGGEVVVHHHNVPEDSSLINSHKSDESDEKKPNLLRRTNKPLVTKRCLRQIKQHSKEIASIKRILKQKNIRQEKESKPDLKTILNEMQPQIPSSLFTIISLLLGEKSQLNDEDIEFFTSLHKASPETYEMLSDKYKWNLPTVDVVDSPPQIDNNKCPNTY